MASKAKSNFRVYCLNAISQAIDVSFLPVGDYYIGDVIKNSSVLRIGTKWWALPEKFSSEALNNASGFTLTKDSDGKLTFNAEKKPNYQTPEPLIELPIPDIDIEQILTDLFECKS